MSISSNKPNHPHSRAFVLIGHRVPPNGPINLNDLAGGSGRIDVLLRALSTALFLSHSMRDDTVVEMVLAGPGANSRRIKWPGGSLRSIPADERGMAGHVRKIVETHAPRSRWRRHESGLFDRTGGLKDILDDWENEERDAVILDALAPRIEKSDVAKKRIGFILSDDRPFTGDDEKIMEEVPLRRSLGNTWLQGHSVIAIIQWLLDEWET